MIEWSILFRMMMSVKQETKIVSKRKTLKKKVSKKK